MISKHKILQAIQEGIQSSFKFSPDSDIDNSSYVDFSDSKVNNIESLHLPPYNYIDLGLSVKWANCNLGATCEDTPESWHGNYYAWGETISKHEFSSANYDNKLYNKYNKRDFQTLQPEDDIVYQTYNKIIETNNYRMPTIDEIQELLNERKIKITWEKDYNGIKGLNGKTFTSKINRNSIFIPETGCYRNGLDDHKMFSDYICLWSSSLSNNNIYNAYYLFSDCVRNYIYNDGRYIGMPIRPVYAQN